MVLSVLWTFWSHFLVIITEKSYFWHLLGSKKGILDTFKPILLIYLHVNCTNNVLINNILLLIYDFERFGDILEPFSSYYCRKIVFLATFGIKKGDFGPTLSCYFEIFTWKLRQNMLIVEIILLIYG